MVQLAVWLLGLVVWPELESSGGGVLISKEGPLVAGAVGLALLAAGLLFSLSFSSLGIVILRSGDFPEQPTWLLVFSPLLMGAGEALLSFDVSIGRVLLDLGAILFGIALTWMGWLRWQPYEVQPFISKGSIVEAE